MSISTEISRIQRDRNTIRAKLVELGMANNTDNLDVLAAAIGDLVNRGAVSVTVQEGDTYTIPKGYHNGSGTVSGVSGGGNYNLQSKTATPTKKQQNIENTLNAKGEAFQNAYQNFVQKAQTNQLTQEQGQAQQAALQRQQQQLQELSGRLQAELQNQTAEYAKAINHSVQNYLKVFNKDRKYGLIFLKVGNNLLYADKAYDITKDVLAGLNKAYKKKPAATDKTDKKAK